jgi:excisionase family DNA binding protein
MLYTTAEAATILRVKKSWLERQAAARKIPFTMLGGCYRFAPAHLAEIVRLNEQLPAWQATSPRTGHRQSRTAIPSAGDQPAPLRARPRRGPRRVA